MVKSDAAQSAMRVGKGCIRCQRGLELRLCAAEIAVFIQDVAQIDPADRVLWPVMHQLLIDGARGGAETVQMRQASQLMQRRQMIGDLPQQGEISGEGLIAFVLGREAPRCAQKCLARYGIGQRLGAWLGVRHDIPGKAG